MERVSGADVESTEVVDGVHLSQLAAGTEMSVLHYRIEPGAVVPEHSHPHEQTGYLMRGSLTFRIDGEEIVATAGDSYAIPGEEPHEVANRGEETAEGVDVFSPPRLTPNWGPGDED
jgi:quercetin dioxygenase-like cupin family protein